MGGKKTDRHGRSHLPVRGNDPRQCSPAEYVGHARVTPPSGSSTSPSWSARMDNLLRWDVVVPQGTIGDKTMYLNYEFRLEYARDLPQPHFLAGGLQERPIGGGAMGMGGMGGGMGGMRSVQLKRE
jgi:hypothetical protein